jgi:hypothetical protein
MTSPQHRRAAHVPSLEIVAWLTCIAERSEAGFAIGDRREGVEQVARRSREPVEAGNQQGRLPLAAFGKRGVELGPVGVAASALNLGEHGNERLAGRKEPPDARALGIEAEATHALPVGRYSVVGHEIRHFPSGVLMQTVVCINTHLVRTMR